MRWVVSVEGLATPVRATILKSLQAWFDLSGADTERSMHPFARLLHRMAALSKATTDVASNGSWILTVPPEHTLSELYAELARHLASRLLLGDIHHLMVVVEVDVDEAFEAMVLDDPLGSRAMTLCACKDKQAKMHDTTHATPFPCKVVRIRCPAFLGDNPAALAKTLDLVRGLCSKAMAVV